MSEKRAEGNHKMTPLQIGFIALGHVITIVLFIVLYGCMGPQAAAVEKLNAHETRIGILETNNTNLCEWMKRIEGKVDKILDLYIKGRK